MAKKTFKRVTQRASEVLGQKSSRNDHSLPKRDGKHIGIRLTNARMIPFSKIKPDPGQPRRTLDQEKLEELSASIKKDGVQQPISVEYLEEGDYFKIIAGERRYQASILAGKKDIPCIVTTEIEFIKRKRLQIIENFQREDLNPIDRALALIDYKDSMGKETNWTDVEEDLSLYRRRRQQLIALLDLPSDIQSEIVTIGKDQSRKNIITERHARALLKLKNDEKKLRKLFEYIKSSSSTVSSEEAMQMAKSMLENNKEEKKITFTFKYTSLTDLADQLKKKLLKIQADIDKEGV